MRKSLALVAAVAATVVLALPASADGAFTSTQTMKDAPFAFPVGPTCGSPAGSISGTANSVFHITVNAANDVWITTTTEGDFVLVPSDTTMPNFAGHFAVWFGVSANMNNFVVHDITNVRGVATDGSGAVITFHLLDHLSVSATTPPNVTMIMSCTA